MAELFDRLPQALQTPNIAASGGGPRLGSRGGRLGRPPGAAGKRSADLGKWIAAEFGGMTPGQQSAELALVRPRDLAKARDDAEQLVKLNLMSPAVLDLRLSRLELAQLVKAVRLGKALGCDARDAWGMVAAERANLMKYVHQVQPAAKPKDEGALPTVFLVPEGAAAQALPDFSDADPDAIEFAEVSDTAEGQVGQAKSDDAP